MLAAELLLLIDRYHLITHTLPLQGAAKGDRLPQMLFPLLDAG
jgi:hypothetical protein